MKRYLSKWITVSFILLAVLVLNVIPPVVKGETLQVYKRYSISVKIHGQKSGIIGTNIPVLAFRHGITSPRDARSGLPTGQRMHSPVVITKELDRTTPILMNVLCTNENLPVVELTFSDGNPKNTFVIKLTNASISGIQMTEEKNTQGPVLEEISFTYQKIEWRWADGGIMSVDDWGTRT